VTRIAIIEDSRIDQCFEAACLRKAGWLVDSIEPTETLAILGHLLEHPPDLLVLDYLLPQLKGDGIAEVCHRHPKLMDIPILVLTAHQDPGLERRLLALGVREVLHKPVRRNQLVDAVRRHLPG